MTNYSCIYRTAKAIGVQFIRSLHPKVVISAYDVVIKSRGGGGGGEEISCAGSTNKLLMVEIT